MDVFQFNRDAWDKQVDADNRWTQPVSSEVIEAARQDDWELVLTPHLFTGIVLQPAKRLVASMSAAALAGSKAE